MNQKTWISAKEAFAKACKYCAYQERTQMQVRQKLAEWGIYGTEAEEIIVKLIVENFINEERFARAYSVGKFRQNQWGRTKIKHGLSSLGLSEYCIRIGLGAIDDDAYLNTLQKLIRLKMKAYTKSDKKIIKYKVARFLVAKGYESDLIWDNLQSVE